MDYQKTIEEAKKFGRVMAWCFVGLAAFFFWRHKGIAPYLLLLGILFQVLAWFLPVLLVPVEKVWMKIGHALGWFNTRVLLTLAFYLIFTPIGWILQLIGKDLLDEKIEKKRKSYWKIWERKDINPSDYERLF